MCAGGAAVWGRPRGHHPQCTHHVPCVCGWGHIRCVRSCSKVGLGSKLARASPFLLSVPVSSVLCKETLHPSGGLVAKGVTPGDSKPSVRQSLGPGKQGMKRSMLSYIYSCHCYGHMCPTNVVQSVAPGCNLRYHRPVYYICEHYCLQWWACW